MFHFSHATNVLIVELLVLRGSTLSAKSEQVFIKRPAKLEWHSYLQILFQSLNSVS